MSITQDDIRKALSRVIDPVTGKDLVALDWLRAPQFDAGTARFILEVPAERAPTLQSVTAAAEAAVGALPGVEKATAILTAHGPAPAAAPEKPAPSLKIGGHPKPQAERNIPGVKTIIAVSSAKGGVGKSTVSSNLAVALAQAGKTVGLLDADIHGPSQPKMMGVSERPTSDGKIIKPLTAHGVTMMSIGLMLPEDEAVIWRGPMLMGALQQMMTQVAWGALDVLVIDLPPGTGDVQLSLCQKFDLAGAIIVSTPQDVALADVRKGIAMFRKLEAPILGMIENMSAFICPHCGGEAHPFGQGGAKAEAARAGIPFLGEIPMDLAIRLAGDGGTPVVAAAPDSPQAAAFKALAAQLVEAGTV
ncbi:P-loop NTPase [Rhodovulum sp. DZ06]|uniref:Mrp/NBP35 family ATP-binding protein n=1 Tax=Rhodovulum sp. DZ06 TaxID=3425126 RepID=UPI003D326EA4